MPLYFIGFLALLATFLLLTLAALLRAIWHRLRASHRAPIDSSRSPTSIQAAEVLLLAGTALIWWNVSTGWVLHFVVYPIYVDMNAVGSQAFHAFSQAYLSRLAAIVLPHGLVCTVWALLLWIPHPRVSQAKIWSIVVLLSVATVVVTPIAANAQGDMSRSGFTSELYARLEWSHGLRAALATAAGVLSLLAIRNVRSTSNNHQLHNKPTR